MYKVTVKWVGEALLQSEFTSVMDWKRTSDSLELIKKDRTITIINWSHIASCTISCEGEEDGPT